MTDDLAEQPQPAGGIDSSVPHSARIWNYWLGGKDNYPIDRIVGDQVLEVFPGIALAARGTRQLIGRIVTHLAGEAGITQFLDIGTGLPTADNTHEVAQRVNPAARVVYVDNDPLVLRYAEALLVGSPTGRTDYLHADLHEPDRILELAGRTLDFSQPIGLMLFGVMGHARTTEDARHTIQTIMAALPSGSFLALSDGTTTSAESIKAHDDYNRSGAIPYNLRDVAEIESFFDGLELVDPGVVRINRWRPPGDGSTAAVDAEGYCGVGRKP